MTSFSSKDRRSFLKQLSVAGLGAVVAPNFAGAAISQAIRRKRYAIVGVGARHGMYQDAIETTYKDHAELVAMCDTNPGRLEVAQSRSRRNGAPVPAIFPAAAFERMIREARPEVVIVTTPDADHADYIVRAMDLGCDAISEKPLATTAEQCREIIEARRRTGRSCRVTFNLRYSPPRTQIKELLMAGEIGDVLSVDFHWMLNTQHGADYFRRWHSQKKISGGLMVHKATHHFDAINWWLGAMPVSVFATGKRDYYTPAMAKRMGLTGAHTRCRTCPEKAKCGFYLDLAGSPGLKSLYLDNEHHDGYFRDRCVFRPDIDIEDTMNVLVGYDNGVTMAYSLNAFAAWEGYHVVFNGTKGRLEHSSAENSYISGTDTVQGGLAAMGVRTKIIPLRGNPREIEPWKGEGSHGGGDRIMLDEIFLPSSPPDKYRRASDERGGAASCMVGIAANHCFETGQPVAIADLLPGLVAPEWTTMPSSAGPLPMPSARS